MNLNNTLIIEENRLVGQLPPFRLIADLDIVIFVDTENNTFKVKKHRWLYGNDPEPTFPMEKLEEVVNVRTYTETIE